jgi:hypothetical protein
VKVAISQPSYLPWSGFFDLVDQVDQFVLLDDAQFVKQSWHQRNRIKSPSGLLWLTVPVIFRGHLGQALSEVMIREPQFWEKHVRAVEVNYGRARYFERYYPTLKKILLDCSQRGRLVDLNIELIRWLGMELEVTTPMVRSSALSSEGRRSARLVSICKLLGAAGYVSPRSASYLIQDMKLFRESGVNVWFQNYTHPIYEQRFPPFVPFASVLDLLFNHGPDSGGIMRSGRVRPLLPEELQATAAECGASI